MSPGPTGGQRRDHPPPVVELSQPRRGHSGIRLAVIQTEDGANPAEHGRLTPVRGRSLAGGGSPHQTRPGDSRRAENQPTSVSPTLRGIPPQQGSVGETTQRGERHPTAGMGRRWGPLLILETSMISLTSTFVTAALAEIRRYPGELSDRPIQLGRILICSPIQVGIRPPSRWVERLREAGLLRPARVRRMPHVTSAARLDGQEREIMTRLLDAGDDGLSLRDLAGGDPSGALEETLRDLYRAGYASPPAGLWATPDRECPDACPSPPRSPLARWPDHSDGGPMPDLSRISVRVVADGEPEPPERRRYSYVALVKRPPNPDCVIGDLLPPTDAERTLNDWPADQPHPLRGVNRHLAPAFVGPLRGGQGGGALAPGSVPDPSGLLPPGSLPSIAREPEPRLCSCGATISPRILALRPSAARCSRCALGAIHRDLEEVTWADLDERPSLEGDD